MDRNFSLIIPIHNDVDLNQIEECIYSIVNQSYRPSEVIVVLDGYVNAKIVLLITNIFSSIDIELKIVENLIKKGPGFARNFGVKFSNFEIIAFMDSDDICMPNRFELQIPLLYNNQFDIVGGQIVEFENHQDHIISKRIVSLLSNDIKKNLKYRSSMNNVTVALKKEIFLKVGGYPNIFFGEDYILWLKLDKEGYQFHNLKEVLVKVRTGLSFFERRYTFKQLQNNFILFRYLIKFQRVGFFYPLARLSTFILLFTMPRTIRKFFVVKFTRYESK
jgi:glycosyltransferase involved in cell wall biosynthesis